jgi:hydroxypyruvate isomerase
MRRRSFLSAVGAGAVSAAAPAAGAGRLNQGVSRWCFNKWSIDELCANAAKIGIKGIDLVEAKDWPTIRKHGLVPSLAPGAATIPDGWNRTENHARLEAEMRENIARAAEAGVRTVITLSGNRRGLPDGEGLENCAAGLKRIKAFAEEKNVLVVMELLNSKVDHKDYQCDHTAWGVELCKRVASPRVKLLYDIYHMDIMEGDLIRTIRDNIQWIGHFHTGGNPGRNELDGSQETNYHAVAAAIADLKFEGFVSHEFVPKRDPFQSLQQAFEICTV